MEKDIGEWTDTDYQFIRRTKDYFQNRAKMQAVLRYLRENGRLTK